MGSAQPLHACPSCRRVLRGASRDALCLQCLDAIDVAAFDDDDQTQPGIVPLALIQL
jgi:hypothetical protein